MVALLLWLVVVEGLALAALPLTARVFRALPDRGYAFSKVVGLLLVGYASWLTSMLGLTTYHPATPAVLALLLALVSWSAWGRDVRAELRERRRLMFALEGVFLATLAATTIVRAYNSDIIGQEKFMDFAFMNAFLTATDLPAEDAWLAGYGTPYYYLGYLLLGVPGKIAGTPGPIAYNLALVYVFATTFTCVTSLVYALFSRATEQAEPAPGPVPGPVAGPVPGSLDRAAFGFGLLGGAMVILFGNLVGPLELIAAAGWGDQSFWQTVGVKNLTATPSGGLLPAEGGWWWRASRVIPNIQPDGITEFPYFSFLLGDLHPHYTAVPLDLLIVGLALVAWRSGGLAQLPQLVLAVVVLGVLVASNTWDLPAFWGLLLAASVLGSWRRQPDRGKLLASLPIHLAPFALAPLAVAPYVVGYQSQPLGLGVVGERTPLPSMLILFGPVLAVCLAFAGWLISAARPRPDDQAGARRPDLLALGGALLVGVALTAVGEPTLALLGVTGILLGWAGWLWLGRDAPSLSGRASGALFGWLLAALGLAILLGVEVLYLRDLFGTRMNTVFKFHYNAWILLGIAGATALGLFWTTAGPTTGPVGWRRIGWRPIGIGLALLVALPGLVYPLAATWTKSAGFGGEPTLDGARFLQRGSPGDYEAIQWLRRNGDARPVVVEAVGPDYQEYARVSTFSGLPTVIGWIGHELQWRGERPEYQRREADVDAIYRAATLEDLVARASPYRARYLFFGSLERAKYGPEAEQRLGRLLAPAFTRGGTTVYDLSSAVVSAQSR